MLFSPQKIPFEIVLTLEYLNLDVHFNEAENKKATINIGEKFWLVDFDEFKHFLVNSVQKKYFMRIFFRALVWPALIKSVYLLPLVGLAIIVGCAWFNPAAWPEVMQILTSPALLFEWSMTLIGFSVSYSFLSSFLMLMFRPECKNDSSESLVLPDVLEWLKQHHV